jgi:AraC family L-rhamnose operon transcriptional activator RhaR
MTIRLTQQEFIRARPVPLETHAWMRDGEYPDHDHDFMEIVVITGGRGVHRSALGEDALHPGDVFILRPGAWHGYRNCTRLNAYDCIFGMELLQRELAWMLGDPALNYLFWSGPLTPPRKGTLFLKLSEKRLRVCREYLEALQLPFRRFEARDAEPPGPAESAARSLGTFLLLLHELASVAPSEPASDGSRPRLHDAVAQGVRLLEEDLTREWSLTELAQTVYLDPSYLSRLFKAATGLPPLAYQARCRAERAAALLRQTELPVGDVGVQVGWPDANYFARRFRQHFGLSPSGYRRRSTGTR